MRIVIIGNGVAGIEAALTIRSRQPDWPITIISEESDHFFSRTALMWVATGQLSLENIEPHERDLYARLRFVRVRDRVVGLDVAGHTVRLRSGAELPYDRLLIASGSKPVAPPWPGGDLAGVGHFVTLQDLEWLEDEVFGGPSLEGRPPNPRAHIAPGAVGPYQPRPRAFGPGPRNAETRRPRHPAVVGGGLIGIEAVEVMLAAGLSPRFYIREDSFWPIALDRREGTVIAEALTRHGVDVRLGESLETIAGQGRIESVTTNAGVDPCDMLVVAIGVAPNTDWLKDDEGKAPVALQERGGGVLVDALQRTSSEDVFAAGDCASVPWFDGSQRPEPLWYTSRDQGRIAGRVILGDSVSYRRGIFYNSAKLMDIEYTTTGLVNMNVVDEENFFFEERGPVRSTLRIVTTGGRVIGFNALGRRYDHEVWMRWITERRDVAHVLKNLSESSFDTEFVPPLHGSEVERGLVKTGVAPSLARSPVEAPVY